jgi:hypothetical protein
MRTLLTLILACASCLGADVSIWLGDTTPVPMVFVPAFTDSNLSYALDDSDDKWAVSAMVTKAATITQGCFGVHSVNGANREYQVSLQSISATTGLPDGTILGGGSPASILVNPVTDSWIAGSRCVTFDNSYSASAGQVLVVVVAPTGTGGNPDGSNNLTIRMHHGIFTGIRADGYGGSRAWSFATAWTADNSNSMFYGGVRSASESWGIIAGDYDKTAISDTNNEQAMRFAAPCAWFATGTTYTIDMARFGGLTPSAGKNLVVTIYEGTTSRQSTTIDTDTLAAAASNRFITVGFDPSHTFTCDTAYYLAVGSDTATPGNFGMFKFVLGRTEDLTAFSMGTNFFWASRATKGGTSFTDDSTRRPTAAIHLNTLSIPAGGGSFSSVVSQ